VSVDLLLKRIERTAVAICMLMALSAFVVTRGRVLPAIAVVAGGLLVFVSYRMIVRGARALGDTLAGPDLTASESASSVPAVRPRSAVLTGAIVVGRYALLTLLAYVMIARLRLPPLGLLAGASSIVAGVALEALRFLLKKTP
jgi:hypothetical protein